MKKFFTLLFPVFFQVTLALSQPQIELVNFASGFIRPLDIANAGDDRLFIVEQRGLIWILDENGNKLPQPFLNIDPSVGSGGNEQGLLGLAFHPDYANNGYFYVNYTKNNGDTRISRFSVLANNPNQADPSSEKILLEVDQPYSNHNGGCLKFGPDGYLYIGLGDGGSGGDPQDNGQDRQTLLGKMLRIDVDGGDPYGIPPGNPFVNDNTTLDEIWAIGLRNPWRFSFDRETGDLWTGDVGQDAWEEINFQPVASSGGENYGWRCYEGNHAYNTNGCAPANTMTFPVAEYQNGASCSVTGGYVYRGCKYPELYGRYLYTDYCTGIIWSLTPDGSGGWVNQQLANLNDFQFASFGENRHGELFLAGLGNGIIYRVTETTESFDYEISITDVTCPADPTGSIALSFTGNNGPQNVQWSTGETGTTLPDLAAGTYSVTITGNNGCTITETLEVASEITLTHEINDELCPGDGDGSIILSVPGTVEPVQAVWNDGETGLVRTGLISGEYHVTLTTDEGCMMEAEFTVESIYDAPAEPVIDIEMDTLLNVSPDYATYQWFLNDEPIPGANSEVLVAKVSGVYSLLVSNAGGCTATSIPVTVDISSTPDLLGIERVNLSPNPFGKALRFELQAVQPLRFTLQMTDVKGAVVFKKEFTAAKGIFTETIDTKQLAAGIYFFILKTENGEWTQRVIKD